MTTRRHRGRGERLAAAALILLLAAGCGDDDDDPSTSDPATTVDDTATSGGATTDTGSGPTDTATTDTGSGPTDTGTAPAQFEQPAVWPAADVVFDTPEEAASDFVTGALGVPAVLGDFMQGDGRSGEIEVLFTGEAEGTTRIVRGLLFLRQLGPDSGWFVLGAASAGVSIEAPEAGVSVPAGPLTVSGLGRGFEGAVIIEAYVAGEADRLLDQQVTTAGSVETPEPYSVELDLSAAESGEMILVLVRGGVGLETDPGDFAALPVQIG